MMQKNITGRYGVAICVDDLMMDCAASLLWSLSEQSAGEFEELVIINQNLSNKGKEILRRISRDGDKTQCRFVTFDSRRWSHARGLHGNYMTWAKFEIPNYSSADFTLYLDCDIVASKSPFDYLREVQFDRQPIGAVSTETQGSSLEREFFRQHGLDPSLPYFNAGVLLFQNQEWRSRNLCETALSHAREYESFCRTADQTIFNFMFSRDFVSLPEDINVAAYPGSILDLEKARDACLVHFVGSPKPWDMGASRLHPNGSIYADVARRVPNYGSLRPPFIRRMFRSARLARSYWRLFLDRWRDFTARKK